jgi:hypothetical protein
VIKLAEGYWIETSNSEFCHRSQHHSRPDRPETIRI